MAANLEAEVRERERNAHIESLGEPKGHEEEEAEYNDREDSEESISALGDFFADLKFALSEDDPSKSVEFLNRAWKIAEESVASLATSN